jgi:hypothetical protein
MHQQCSDSKSNNKHNQPECEDATGEPTFDQIHLATSPSSSPPPFACVPPWPYLPLTEHLHCLTSLLPPPAAYSLTSLLLQLLLCWHCLTLHLMSLPHGCLSVLPPQCQPQVRTQGEVLVLP